MRNALDPAKSETKMKWQWNWNGSMQTVAMKDMQAKVSGNKQ